MYRPHSNPIFAILPWLLLVLCCRPISDPMNNHVELYVGTYTDGESEGIYKCLFDTSNAHISEPKLVAYLDNPSFLKVHPHGKILYAVQETDNYDALGGAISTFEISSDSLHLINTRATKGAHPCHIGLDHKYQFLAISNYTGGNVCIYKLAADGSTTDEFQLFDHHVNDTSTRSHAHAAHFYDDQLFVADLGHDALYQYRQTQDSFVPSEIHKLELQKGAGPRHFSFSADKNALYVINELNSTITVFKKNKEGDFVEAQTISTLSNDFNEKSYCADIHLSSDGKFLYGSNRGENTIVVFEILPSSEISFVDRVSVHGDWPRNFSLDPSEKFLLVANQRSDNICIFSRDQISGKLTFLNEIHHSKPVCLEFLD